MPGKDVRRMAYQKYIYSRINWVNKSDSLTTPLGKTNLNRMDSAIYNIAENLDVVHNDLGSGKFDKADAGKVIVGMPTWNPNTGILTFRFYDGTQFSVDFNVEKIPVSFSMDSAGVITMTTSDGTQWTANIGDVVPDYAFDDSETITFVKGYDWDTSQYSQIDAYGYGPPDNWAVSENKDKVYLDRSSGIAYACAYDGKKYFLATSQLQRDGKNVRICGEVRKGSITGEHLRPDYLADVSAQAGDAAASAKSASDSADDAAFDAKLAQSYAVGGSGVRQGEDADNAKKYKELCQGIYDNFQQSGSVTGVKGAEEDVFRHGNVDITPENIGAFPCSSTAGSDFNAMTTPGVYMMPTNKNAPTTTWGWSLIVTNDSIGGVSQIAVYGSHGGDAFIRSRPPAGEWTTWQRTLMTYDIANNLVTTNAGYVLDARQGKALKDEINGINECMSQTIKVRYVFKDYHLSAGSTYTGYYVQSPIGTSEIVVFSVDGSILWLGYARRNSGGYGMFTKIFGEAEATIPANGPDGFTHFYLDRDCNRMAVINI